MGVGLAFPARLVWQLPSWLVPIGQLSRMGMGVASGERFLWELSFRLVSVRQLRLIQGVPS